MKNATGLICNQGVTSSNLVAGTIFLKNLAASATPFRGHVESHVIATQSKWFAESRFPAYFRGRFGLVSRKRGRPSKWRQDNDCHDRVMTIARENHSNFGPTLATEYLFERHGVTVDCETQRQIKILEGL